MARIRGINLPKNKRIIIGLMSIYGIGKNTSKKILQKTKIDENTKVSKLTDNEINAIRHEIENEILEGDLRREKSLNIKRLMEIGCYRGIRHRKKLPVHGQRTRCNARTRKGPRKTVANKKKAAQKK